jgi:hypothetical protein
MATPKAPSWFKPNTKGSTDLGSLQNALLPYLGYEGQISAAANLATGDPTNFGTYQPSSITPPSRITPEMKKQFLSIERADRALAALNRMQSVAGISATSPGYKYLYDTVSTLKKHGGPGRAMSRSQYLNFTSAINALRNSQAASDAEGAATVAGYFSTPTTSAGDIMPVRTSNGRTIFGTANRRLFG